MAWLINRGDVWWADIPEVGPHPAVVVTRQVAIPLRTDVTVVLITTVSRGILTEVALDTGVGLREPSVANCDQLHTIPKASLSGKIGFLRFEEARAIDRALMISLDLGGG